MRRSFVTALILAMAFSTPALAVNSDADFDDLSLLPESYWNGSDLSGGFSSGPASFNNSFTDWGGGFTSWDGFAYSNLSQAAPPLTGVPGQYTAIPGNAQSSTNYAIGYVGYAGLPTMTLTEPQQLAWAYFTNNNYNYYTMLNGDGFSKQFGGPTSDDPDWFMLSIEGFDEQENSTGTVDFYLADYRFADNSLDYIVNDWTWTDLSSLGEVQKLTFNLSSSDNGDFGMNTPAYFAMDTIQPMIVDIQIDIRPGSDRNPVNPKSKGVLPVAILGAQDFDVHNIDLLSLELAGAKPRTPGQSGNIGSFEDVNDDAMTDLVLHFDMDELNISDQTTELALEGLLNDGRVLTATQTITIVPPGDVNGDGLVGGADLTAVITNWGIPDALLEQGDLDGDGLVGGTDFTQVVTFWGSAAAPPEPIAIPEPSVCVLLTLGGLAILRRRS